MKISSSANKPVYSTPAPARGAGVAQPASGSGKSAVDLSPAARQLASLQNSDHDINLERVQQLRDAIAAGQLKIDPSRIADALLASARELLK